MNFQELKIKRDDDNKHIRAYFVKILTDNRNGKNLNTLYFNCLGCSSHTYYLYILWKNYVKKCQLSNQLDVDS